MKLKHLLLLLMTIVSFSTARAATDGSDFTFNDGVRYSQWAISSRLNSFCANTATMGLAVYDENGNTVLKREDGGKKKLDYVPGLVAKGIIEAVKYYQQYPWAASWVKPLFLSVADYGNQWYNVSEAGGSLDDLNGVKMYMTLSELASSDGAFPDNTAYNNAVAAIGHAVNGLKAHNNDCVIGNGTLAGDNVTGGWWHKKAYNNQMWLDGQYMGPALLAQIINHNKSTANISADDWNIIIKQLDAVWQMCWNSTDKLMYHAFEANGGTGATDSHAEVWAGLSASNLHSASYWGRACGWYFLALVDILHEMDNAKISSQNTYTNDDYTRIKGYLTSLAEGLKARQDTETGGWYQILDKDADYSASVYNNGQTHTQTYNYIESSATAIFAATYLKAIRLGYLAESEYGETARKAYRCIVDNFFAADGKDGVHIFGSCRSAGLGSDKTDGTALAGKRNFRDGSNEYYLLGSDVTRVAKSANETEGKVLGAFILASTEYEQLYQKDKFLFSKDLAPVYTLAGAGDCISMEAFGADNIEYKWYNVNDVNTVVATTSTFTPAESGRYYCTATADGKTITSSTTNVTVTTLAEANNAIKFSLSDIKDESGNVSSGGDYKIINAILIGGEAFVHNGKTSAASMVKGGEINLSGSGNSYLCVTLGQSLSAGDVITIDDGVAGSMYITATDSKSGATVKTLPYTITEADGFSRQNKLYLWRDGIKILKKLTITISSSTCMISYNTNGHGTAPGAKSVAKGYTLTEADLPVLTAEGYTFEGWYTDAECTEPHKVAVSTVIDVDITLYAKWGTDKSSDTATSFGGGSLDGTTLTVDSYASTEAGSSKSISVTLPAKATAVVTSGNADFADGILTYTAPAAGQSMAIKLLVTAEAGNTAEYTINVSTKSAGDVTRGNAIFTIEELSGFGVLSGQAGSMEKQSVTLEAVAGTEGNVQGQTNGTGTKVQKTAGFTITPKAGFLITRITLVTDQNNRRFDATPAQAGDVVQDDKTYEYSFNSIGDAVTFKNNTGNGIYVKSIIVEYEKSVDSGKTVLTASFDKDELTFYEGDDVPAELPVLSVKAGNEVAGTDLYSVKYTSSNANVVTVDANGKLTKVGAGSAVINAEITPVNAETYAGTEAFYTVTVKPLEEPVVTVHDLTVYNTAGIQPQPVIEVFATNDGTPLRISNYYYTLKFAEIEDKDDIIKSDADGKFVLNGEAGNWKVGATATMKVAVIPTDEAKQKFHIKETAAEFKVTVVVTGDMLLSYFGGVEKGKMQKSALVNERTFITPVLYGGVDISTGFTFDYSFVDAISSTTASTTAARLKNGSKKVTSITDSKDAEVTIYSGDAAETVYIHVVAKPNTDYETQYKQIEKWISVDIAEYKRFMEVSIEPTKQVVPVGTVLDQLNDFTVTVRDENGKTLSYEDGEYTMTWQSSSPGVASVDRDEVEMYAAGRKIHALSGGVADIKVIVSKGEYSDMGAVCTLTVTDDGMFKVDGNTPYSKGAQFTVDGLTLSLGGWMFSNMSALTEGPWSKYGTTSEKPGEKTAWGAPTTKNKKPLGFTHNIQMTNMKNARQEYGSNCMPESRNIYNPKLVEQKFMLIDPMFNVPCAGAYFALSPMTCGTVTVYVRQNGIFEQSGNEYAYRPQRRVFVMDEQGRFVSSTPKLEYPTNWGDDMKDGTLFKCDILDKTVKEKSLYELAGADPTKVNGDVPEEEKKKVRKYVEDRLVGLKNFSIQNFKNGVYASNIVDTTFHNAAYENHPDDLAARGWSVLSVAPVSYTFYVKPGKTYYIYNFGSKLGLYGFKFRKDNVTEDEYNWTDTKDVTPELTAERHVAKVNIDRTFKAGVWAAGVLPFSMTRQQVNAVFGDCYDNQAGHEDGTQILYFDRVEGNKIYFRRHAYNTLVAGKPFLIKPAKEAVISSANMGDYPYVTIEAATPLAEWGRTVGNAAGLGTVDTDYTWVSSYGSMTALPGDYYLNGSGDVSHCTEGHQISIKGFRGYLKAKTKQAASKVLSLYYDSNIDDDGGATAIDGLVMDSDGNFLEVPASGIVYNLSGQVVTREADKLYTLPAGIYIVNGKKYIVR